MKRKTIAGAIAGAALLASAIPAFAHKATTFDPGPGCMGKMTSFHAQDPDKGLRHNYEDWNGGAGMPHGGIANLLGVDSATNFQEFMKLNQKWCKSE